MIRALRVVLWIAIALNLVLLVIELAAGVEIYVGSLLAIAILLTALWLLHE